MVTEFAFVATVAVSAACDSNDWFALNGAALRRWIDMRRIYWIACRAFDAVFEPAVAVPDLHPANATVTRKHAIAELLLPLQRLRTSATDFSHAACSTSSRR